jgi:molecular chaperone DnaK
VLQLPFLANDQHGAPINYEKTVTREQIEELTKALLDRVTVPCERALTDAGLDASDIEEVLLVGGMTRWPAVQERVEAIFAKKPSKGANPDEVVALGAAAYAGILAGEADDAALLDVTPHDIGIKVGDSGFSVIIPRNSMLPVRARKLFATTSPDQKFVSIELYQGEASDVTKNRKLGQITLDDLPPGPPGSVRVELVITVDVESIVGATAKEMRTGKETSITIRPSGGLSQREIVEIINRRRNEKSVVNYLPVDGGNVVRVTTREQAAVKPPPDQDE